MLLYLLNGVETKIRDWSSLSCLRLIFTAWCACDSVAAECFISFRLLLPLPSFLYHSDFEFIFECVCIQKHKLSICQILFTDRFYTWGNVLFFVCFVSIFFFFQIESACKWMAPVINQNLRRPSYLVLTCSPTDSRQRHKPDQEGFSDVGDAGNIE